MSFKQPRWILSLCLLTLLVPATGNAQEEIIHAARHNSPAVTVERTYASPARQLTMPAKKLELMTGVDITSKGDFGLPLGGGYGITDKIEAGGDLMLFFHPFGGKALFSNLKAYARYHMLPELLALQFTFNVVGAMGDPMALSFEVDAPLLLKLLSSKKLWIYVQTQLAMQALLLDPQNDFGMSLSIGMLGMYLITPSIFVDLEHQLSFIFAPDFFAPYADTPIPLGFGGGYLHQATMTAIRLNVMFYDLSEVSARGVGFLLTATHFMGG